MTTLITVDDFGFSHAECSLQTVHDEGLLQGVGKLKINNSSAVPVKDDEQIHEPFLHPDVGNINAPNLIRSCNRKAPQKIRTNILGVISLAEIGLRINRVNTHTPHHATYFLPIDEDVVVTTNHLCNHPVTPSRMPSMQLINPPHEKQILVGNRSSLRRVTVYAGSVDFKKICLATDGNGFLTEINEISSSSRARGFAQIFF